jgi:hypothetical protein
MGPCRLMPSHNQINVPATIQSRTYIMKRVNGTSGVMVIAPSSYVHVAEKMPSYLVSEA